MRVVVDIALVGMFTPYIYSYWIVIYINRSSWKNATDTKSAAAACWNGKSHGFF